MWLRQNITMCKARVHACANTQKAHAVCQKSMPGKLRVNLCGCVREYVHEQLVVGVEHLSKTCKTRRIVACFGNLSIVSPMPYKPRSTRSSRSTMTSSLLGRIVELGWLKGIFLTPLGCKGVWKRRRSAPAAPMAGHTTCLL